MSPLIEVKVPDIGDFTDVPIVEVLVKPGDSVKPEDPLITLESDKATLEIPAPQAGTVRELRVKVGDKVSQGTLILTLDAGDAAAVAASAADVPAAPAKSAPAAAPVAPVASPPAPPTARGDIHAEVVVLGAGPGGYTAAFRAADLGKQVVLIERYPTLGGVCLNVGCIPSKALLHVAKVIAEAGEMERSGVTFGKPKIEIDKLRAWKDGVIRKLTQGLGALARQRKVTVIQGRGEFASPHTLRVATQDGVKTVSFDHCIIAAGASVARIPGFPYD
ncbi:MAG: FAD-dependent oxidoreductase, partial [Betaproteobacteria bacterium]|nr:FAD-dependent oxidoreductase [Betaproteobacteria bacterium]